MTATPKPSRRHYIDWARGLAVLVMIEAHTLDAWTRPAARRGLTYRNLNILGGFAAPLFLWLAGMAVVLAAESALRRTGNRRAAAEAICRRGLEIFVLAFLFRLQGFIVSPGNPLIALFRVDILNVMGVSIVAAALVWALVESRWAGVAVSSIIAAAIAMATPIVRTAAWVGELPVWIQWYVRPAGEYTVFTLFPWSGFVLAGAACGILMVGTERTARLQAALAVTGAGLLALGFYTAALPTIYRTSSFWTSSPTYFAIRIGVMHLLLAALYGVERLLPASAAVLAPVERFGRRSLFVYWVHVELVYGYATWFVHGRLWLWPTMAATVVFTLLMYWAVVLWDRMVANRGLRIAPNPSRLEVAS